jgi:tetratricopeptide (TPR) repeat protein
MIKSTFFRHVILSLILLSGFMFCGATCKTGFDESRIQSLDIEAKMYYEQGVRLSKENKSQEALGAFATSVRLDPNAAAYCGLSTEYYRLGNYDMALLYANRAIMVSPKYAFAYFIRGNTYFRMNKYDMAIKSYLQAARLDPACSECYFNLGQVYYKKGLPDDALKSYSKAAEVNPHYNAAWYNRACILSQKNDLKEAVASLERAAAEGFSDVERMMSDPALENVRKQQKFKLLVKKMERGKKKPQ